MLQMQTCCKASLTRPRRRARQNSALAMASATALVGVLLLLAASSAGAVKLKIRREECMQFQLTMYEPFYGSFVSLPDVYYHVAAYVLTITSPTGTKIHETGAAVENKFHLVPYETGRYRFCLSLVDSHYSRYVTERDVAWELHVGHADYTSDHAKEHDTQSLWHYVHMVDAQIQQLRSTVSYLHWREKRHRMTADSTNSRVAWYGLGRSLALVAVSILQVVGVRYLFRGK